MSVNKNVTVPDGAPIPTKAACHRGWSGRPVPSEATSDWPFTGTGHSIDDPVAGRRRSVLLVRPPLAPQPGNVSGTLSWSTGTSAAGMISIHGGELDRPGPRRPRRHSAPRAGPTADARQAGDDGVPGLDKITAQMPGGRAPARATGDVPRRGRGDGHGHPPRRAGRDRDREVAGLPRAGRAERQEGRRRHGDQGAAGPAGREGPAPGRGGPRAAGPAGLRRAEGAQQLRLPTAGGRGGLGWDPGGARRPGGRAGRRARRWPRKARSGRAPARRPKASSRKCASWWRGRRSRRAATGPTSASSPPTGPGTWSASAHGSAPAPTTARRAGAASPRRRRERASVADVVVVNTHLYGAHLASGGVVLPEHDVVIFDEAHELEEVMTSSLGVEVTPGRFRSLVTSARALVEARDADLLDVAGLGRRPARRAAR